MNSVFRDLELRPYCVFDESILIKPKISWKDFCNQAIEFAVKKYQHPGPKYDYIRLKLGKK